MTVGKWPEYDPVFADEEVDYVDALRAAGHVDTKESLPIRPEVSPSIPPPRRTLSSRPPFRALSTALQVTVSSPSTTTAFLMTGSNVIETLCVMYSRVKSSLMHPLSPGDALQSGSNEEAFAFIEIPDSRSDRKAWDYKGQHGIDFRLVGDE